jgi:hypothetical protein
MTAFLDIQLALFLAVPPGASSDAGSRQPLPTTSIAEAQSVEARAKTFFTDLLARRIREVAEQSELPFHLEGRTVTSRDQLIAEWTKALANKRLDLLTLYGIQILTPSEMEKKYGDPPARLSTLPWRKERTYLAVANISGRAAIAVLHRTARGWHVVGYAD